MSAHQDITQILGRHAVGDLSGFNDVYAAVYSELKSIARYQLRKAWSIDNLNATILVNEAYIKLSAPDSLRIENRKHFFALAARAMRQVLVNHIEQQYAQKRGGDWLQQTYTESIFDHQSPEEEFLFINEVIDKVRNISDDLANLIELKCFGGMTEVEIAELLSVHVRTVRRNWQKAKLLLLKIMDEKSSLCH
ncbi:ECF-type sigma factor [Marinibactrum halimedae]|uniref:DNA-directed RNA polymerase sigma-70 factor n=1 Tax=Marinibactrum halimedae TaxID=1444977 RepID=A0AA37T3E4_9GAMM|nr:ECF-type sigma factor [Marinibactrum halimedae]MCD9459716.1 hypothetical protein [Marinibactrum halimedae]GLS24527.1 DNA-directed RNA polymerase sigma-70 factor [Marinibactrum halimedae]